MADETPNERLRRARTKRGYATARDAARAFGWNENTYGSHENGNRPLSRKASERYAKAFRVSLAWLLTGEGSMGKRDTVPIVGYIGAGQEVLPVDDHALGNGIDEADMPPSESPPIVAVRVRGDSMWPAYHDGDTIYYGEHRPPQDLIGRECVVRLEDSRVFVKTIEAGSAPGYFNLISYNAASPPMRDVKLEWAAPVKWISRK